jgi:micrococcal nuclease
MMMIGRRRLLGLAAPTLAMAAVPGAWRPAGAAPGTAPAPLVPGGTGVAAAIPDGGTVLLDSGAEIRLVGLAVPRLRSGRPPQPYAPEAGAALSALVLGRRVSLLHGGTPRDRHGRVLAHLHLEDGTWVQGRMLEGGHARMESTPDNRALATEMLALEAAAREARRGLWRLDAYRLREAGPDVPAGMFQIVEGTVLAAARVGRRLYLNFGEDWRSDFTVAVQPGDLPAFRSAGLDLLATAGRRLRVRGWVYLLNGPVIDATHPEQVELPA